ncbi:LysR substrate-binding domain-containing protein [Pusillimonas sp. ANT_WB101]|uniref:LysR substrate-binding domain-containing protein n=1 Tax=Pusillimonas sp. ANT_WB101 TaxID=2597356 RepID=UPI0011ECACA7|nr:LysR substrate-binding domain-containing protein [Pusillimonas sp. ANT_WB101]KAA0892684.1 LysR family transcriptional regulator [Pusillimonas sp. ANT_WB101]
MISSRQLEAFVILVEKGSLTKAAEAMDVSQPTVSKLIRNLEREVRMKLFVSERQRLVPTPEALLLAERARRTVDDLRTLHEFATELRHLDAGRLDLIAIGALSNPVLVEVLAQMARDTPEVSFSLSVSVERDIAEWLVSSQADWALSMMPVDRPEIVCEPLLRVAACCALPIGHRLAHQAVVYAEELEGERFISFRRDGRLRPIVDRIFLERSVRRRLNIEVYSSEQACAMVAHEMGVAIVEPFSAHKYVTMGQLVVRHFEPVIPYSVYLLRNRQRPVSALGGRFIEVLSQRLPRILSTMKVRTLDGYSVPTLR